jgi:hypothetical protein
MKSDGMGENQAYKENHNTWDSVLTKLQNAITIFM